MDQFPDEWREGAGRPVFDGKGQHGARWQAILSIAAKIGCSAPALNERVTKAEVDSGKPAGIPTEMAARMRVPQRELRRANEILRKASAYFAMAELDHRSKSWRGSAPRIGMRRGPSRSAAFRRSPHPPLAIIRSGGLILPDGRTVHGTTRRCDPRSDLCSSKRAGVPEVRRQLGRDGLDVAGCTVARLMKSVGLDHHRDRGSQYLSIRRTERPADAAIEPSAGCLRKRRP